MIMVIHIGVGCRNNMCVIGVCFIKCYFPSGTESGKGRRGEDSRRFYSSGVSQAGRERMSSRKKFKVNYSNVSCHSVRDHLESLVTHASREYLVNTYKPRVHGLTDFHQRYGHKMHPSFFSPYWSTPIELLSRRNPSRAKLTDLFSSPDNYRYR